MDLLLPHRHESLVLPPLQAALLLPDASLHGGAHQSIWLVSTKYARDFVHIAARDGTPFVRR